jgi:hypothetical protein
MSQAHLISRVARFSGNFKRTKIWSDGWLAKLRDDQRTAKAELAVMVSTVVPKGVETFELVEVIWVTQPRAIVPAAIALRHMLIEVNCARQPPRVGRLKQR